MRKLILGAGIIAVCCVAVISALWAAPPLRLAAPSLFGLHCVERVCTELEEDLAAAQGLVAKAAADVRAQTGLAIPQLNAALCRSDDCYRRFGGGDERAISYPFLGMAIAGHSWQDYIIRHELIHWLQFQHFGAIETMSHPIWFREGMAYALSSAPDWDIPDAFKTWMAQYRDWQAGRPDNTLFAGKPAFD